MTALSTSASPPLLTVTESRSCCPLDDRGCLLGAARESVFRRFCGSGFGDPKASRSDSASRPGSLEENTGVVRRTMERETGFEPATSTLAIQYSIDNKELVRQRW